MTTYTATYTPTKEELIEMGFIYEKEEKQWLLDIPQSNTNLYYKELQELTFAIVVWGDLGFGLNGIYPESKEDILTLIRLFTPNP